MKEALSIPHIKLVNQLTGRDEVLEKMKSQGVFCGIHYPVPVHLQQAIKTDKSESYANAELCAEQELSLPMFPELSEVQMDYVIESLTKSLIM